MQMRWVIGAGVAALLVGGLARAWWVEGHGAVTAAKVLIATGGRPWMPKDLPGVEHAISSNEAFHLEQLPKSIVVAGGGYIALEFACIFNGLGVETTVVHRGPIRGRRQFVFRHRRRRRSPRRKCRC